VGREEILRLAANLRDLRDRWGGEALESPRRVRGKLLDARAEAPAVEAVLAAMRTGAPGRLAATAPSKLRPALAREARRLRREAKLSSADAAAALEVWLQVQNLPVPGVVAGGRRWPWRLAAGGLVALLLAGALWELRRPDVDEAASFNATDPVTWPLRNKKATYAVVIPGGDQCLPRHFAPNPAGCVRSAEDLGGLEWIGLRSPPAQALYFEVAPRNGDCPLAAEYRAAHHCLSEVALPNETGVEVVVAGQDGCKPQTEIALPDRFSCLIRPASPALRGPWKLVGPRSLKSPNVLSIARGILNICERPDAVLINENGFCLYDAWARDDLRSRLDNGLR